MPKAKIHAFTGYEDSGVTLMARVVGSDGNNLTQAATTAITCKVYDGSGTNTLSPTVTVASAIFDTLQTDARWTADATGYNFRFEVPATAFPSAKKGRHRVEFLFDQATGENFFLIFEGPIISVKQS